MYHYTYRIINIKTKKEYIGVRSCEHHPEDDIGKLYFSSSTDDEFMLEQENTPENFQYQIISIHPTRTSAVQEEVDLHAFFDLKNHNNFYNKANQTSVGFDTTGISPSPESIAKGIKTKRQNGNLQPSEKTKNKISKTLKGREVSWGSKISASKRANPYVHTQQERDRMSKKQRESYASGTRKPMSMLGASNPAATRIEIYNSNHVLQFSCDGTFKKVCKENNLPTGRLQESYLAGGTKIYINSNQSARTRLKRNGNDQFIGWYAVRVGK